MTESCDSYNRSVSLELKESTDPLPHIKEMSAFSMLALLVTHLKHIPGTMGSC